MTASDPARFPIHVKLGELVLSDGALTSGLKTRIARELGIDMRTLTVGSPLVARNPGSGLNAFCGSGSSSSGSSSSGSMSRASASRYTSSMGSIPSSTPSSSSGSLSRASASRYTSSMTTRTASATPSRTSYASPASVSRASASRYTSSMTTAPSSTRSAASQPSSLSRASASRYTSSMTTSRSTTAPTTSVSPSTTRSYSGAPVSTGRSTPGRSSAPSFSEGGSKRSSSPSLTRASASRYTSSVRTAPSTPSRSPSSGITQTRVSPGTGGDSGSSRSAASGSSTVTRANASRFTSSLQTTPSRSRANYPSRAAPSQSYASRYTADQQRRQVANQAGLDIGFQTTGQPGPTVQAAAAAGHLASYAGAGLTAQGVRSYMQTRQTPTVTRNNRYGTAFQNRGLSSPFPQRKFTTAHSTSLPRGATGATGFMPDRFTPTATNPNVLDLFDRKAVATVQMTPQLRNYASALNSGMTQVRDGARFGVNSVTFELGRPRLSNTTVVQPGAAQQGFNFVDSRGRALTAATSGPNAGSIVVNHGPNWSAVGNQALRWGGRALVVADPLVHGVVAGTNTPTSAPWHERWTTGITAAAQRADNVLVAGGSGTLAAGATSLSGPGALAVGAGTAVAVGTAYEDTAVDRWVDRQVGRAEPVIGATLRGVDTGARFVGRTAGQAADYVADSYVGQRTAQAASNVASGWNSLTSSVGNLFSRPTEPAQVWSGSRSPLRSGSLAAPTPLAAPGPTRQPSRGGLSGLFGF